MSSAPQVTMKQLLEAGVHYGHHCRRWNPKMAPYIFGERNGIHVIDLQKTVKKFRTACQFLESVTSKGGNVLFVGTKRQARDFISNEASRVGMFYINQRWLGGTLTNFQTIRKSIHTLKKIEKMSQDGTFEKLTKKEALNLSRTKEKLERNLGGIKDMPNMPSALFVVDANRESIAIKEANRLGIPVVAINDTNTDPTNVDYVIPGNDDSIKSVKLFVSAAAEACQSGKMQAKSKGFDDRAQKDKVEEGSFYDDQGHTVNVEKRKKHEADS